MAATETLPEQKVPRGYLKELLGLVKELKAVSDKCARIGIEKINIEAAERQIAERMEDLPIVEEDNLSMKGVRYFILSGNEWYPVHAGFVAEAQGGLWLNYSIHYQDGTVESGVVQPYHWANCTADNTVNYHWFDEEE